MSAESKSSYTPLPPFAVDRGGLQYNHTLISMDIGPDHPSNRGDSGGGDNDPFFVSLLVDPPLIQPPDSSEEEPVFPGTYKVNVGWGYVCERLSDTGVVLTYHYPIGIDTLMAIEVNQSVCVKVRVKSGGSIGAPDPQVDPPVYATTIVVMDNADIVDLAPTTEPGFYYYKLAELVTAIEPGDPPVLTKWLTGSHIDHFVSNASAGTGDHMWKVTSSGPAGGVSPDTTYSVAGGIAVIQGTRVTVAAKPNLAASGGTGFVVLKVTRNSASRVYDPGNIPVIEFYTTVPPSTYAAEYTVLAETLAVTVPAVIPGDPPTYRHDIAQCRSDEICSYELLIVANGEFALLPVQANSRNSYAPPLP